jgi:uncharacterized repeat protein (TIGR01451 family)
VDDTGNPGSVNGGNGEAVFSYPDPISTDSPSYTATEGQTLTVPASNGLLSPAAGTSGPAGDTLTAAGPASGTTTQGGTVSVNADGSFTYTPPSPTFTGSDTFGYTVSDGFDYATGTATIQVQPAAADLSLANSGSPSPVVSGQPLTYTITASNTGGQDAADVTVTDPLPASAVFGSVSTSQGTCTRSTSSTPKTKDGTVTCSLGTLAGGGTATVTITVTPTKPGTLTDTATVTASNITPSDSDDSATATVTVQGT